MGQLSLTLLKRLASALNTLAVGRYSITDVVCFYDWIMSFVKSWRLIETRNENTFLTSVFRLDQEVTFIYPAPWNVVKGAYIYCRYQPLVIAPFYFWGLLGNQEQRVCESYSLSRSSCLYHTYDVISTIHPDVAYVYIYWEERNDHRRSFDLLRSCWGYYLCDRQTVNPSVAKTLPAKCIPDSSMESQGPSCSFWSNAPAVSPFRINRLSVYYRRPVQYRR
ncbi:hypothetical protein EDB84DRAFT_847657 [Lactarius hengduanensis]|nr:hypothetical protein EDB84DRAFT_847657 [Lactarius hengduanensis]